MMKRKSEVLAQMPGCVARLIVYACGRVGSGLDIHGTG